MNYLGNFKSLLNNGCIFSAALQWWTNILGTGIGSMNGLDRWLYLLFLLCFPPHTLEAWSPRLRKFYLLASPAKHAFLPVVLSSPIIQPPCAHEQVEAPMGVENSFGSFQPRDVMEVESCCLVIRIQSASHCLMVLRSITKWSAKEVLWILEEGQVFLDGQQLFQSNLLPVSTFPSSRTLPLCPLLPSSTGF